MADDRTTQELWTIGAKVANLQEELRFMMAVGATPILPDDEVVVNGRVYRIPLIRWGPIRVHLAEEMVYEESLGAAIQPGLAHVVFTVEDLDAARQRALEAGASEISPPARVEAGFGVRDVAFFRSPGGILFEYVRMIDDRVGDR